ncbi:uncharacterized protein C8Q71DRAFT_859473 [Rhodofomes roseus]|uniref:Uncharacterized protein n=1 Tax=Rhodofomes roseus TaxID=34475 RepID=A0ABQ8KAR9_9APHY|nr:uncharacterized protein C8Q71DRAFT_859473 [Rhodofomes roseus]KAH9834478.1 hypothetical protein C8Q71DRAFT_859473 [Rhodofomes roseus]
MSSRSLPSQPTRSPNTLPVYSRPQLARPLLHNPPWSTLLPPMPLRNSRCPLIPPARKITVIVNIPLSIHPRLPRPPTLLRRPLSYLDTRLVLAIRKGFWNRRGGHLVYDLSRWCIVYAPRNLASPSELAQYPSPLDGFMNHHGQKVKYDPNVPKLPESLLLHG